MPNHGHRLHAGEDPVTDVVNSGGTSLDPRLRADMESRFGHDFSDVRVHADARAHESASSVNARAYTVGSDIVFQRGTYDPSSQSGQHLLAHELTHVVQQRSGPVSGTDTGAGFAVSDPGDRFEREAAANATRVMSTPAPSTDSVLALQSLSGNQAVGRYLDVQRCGSTPPDLCGCHDDEEQGQDTVQRQAMPVVQRQQHPRDVDPRPNFGPSQPTLSLPPIFSFGVKDEKPYVKVEEIPNVGGEAPELYILPAHISAELKEWAKKQAGGKADGANGLPRNLPPTKVPFDVATRWAWYVCQGPDGQNRPGCPGFLKPFWLNPQQPPAPGPPGPPGQIPDLGALWTDRVTFLRDRPLPGAAGGASLTPEGKTALDGVIGWLKLDPKLRVRLIGHSSSEGGAEHNQQLSARRAAMIAQAITAAGFGDRIQDPILSDGKEAGCQKVGPGRWSCGDTRAAAEPDPADRVVEATFSRDLDVTLTPPSLFPSK